MLYVSIGTFENIQLNLHYRNEKNIIIIIIIIIIISLPPGVWSGTTILVVTGLLTRKMIGNSLGKMIEVFNYQLISK